MVRIRVSDPADRFEQEAAATAHRAMQEPAPVSAPAAPAVQSLAVQREEAPEEDKEEAPVQGAFVQREAEEEESAEE